MQRLVLATAAVLGLVTALPAAAQFRNAEAAIKYRQSVMTLQNYHLGRIFAMVNGRVPFDAKVAAEDAAVVDLVDHLPFVAFTVGSDTGAKTAAKPEIWKERAKFDAMAVKLQEETAKLHAAAKTGSLDAIKPAVGAVAEACKACHDLYRKE